MKKNNIKLLGYIEKGSGKHQSNCVYSRGGVSPVIDATVYKHGINIVIRKNGKKNKNDID